MTLNTVKNETTNKYCGPGIISAITGLDTDTIEKEIQFLRKNSKPVGPVYLMEVRSILLLHKFSTKQVAAIRGTLFYNLQMGSYKPGLYIFHLHLHVVGIEIEDLYSDDKRKRSIYFIDNIVRQPINAGAAARLGDRVLEVFKVERME